MLLRLLLIFTVVPLIELALLLRIAQAFDWRTALGLVILTGVAGAWLARREGIRVLSRIRSEMEAGRPPADALVDGMLILFAGALLVTPGILTDLWGFLLLIPPFRRHVRRRLAAWFKKRVLVVQQGRDSSFTYTASGWSEGESFIDVPGEGRDADSNVNDSG